MGHDLIPRSLVALSEEYCIEILRDGDGNIVVWVRLNVYRPREMSEIEKPCYDIACMTSILADMP